MDKSVHSSEVGDNESIPEENEVEKNSEGYNNPNKNSLEHEEAAVGSISHIMRTTFKDLFEDFQPRKSLEGSITPILSPKGSITSVENAEEGEDGLQSPRSLDGSHQNQQDPKEDEPSEPLLVDDAAEEADAQSTGRSGEDDEGDEESAGVGTARVTLMKRHQESMDNALREKLDSINKRLEEHHSQAEALLKYLHETHSEAQQQDRAEEDGLKKKGLIVGAHVPALPTVLDLPRSKLLEVGGGFADHLLDARKLVGDNLYQLRRRAGNTPWAGEQGVDKAALLRPEVPGYLKPTPAHVSRETMNLETSTAVRGQRYQPKTKTQQAGEDTGGVGPETLDWDFGLGEDYDADKEAGERNVQAAGQPSYTGKGALKTKKKKKGPTMKLDQENEEMRIMMELDHKLTFLKNPRYDTAAQSNQRMLTSLAPGTAMGIQGLFVANPSEVSFHDYQVDESYSRSFNLRNVSAVSRSLRILPPATQYFHIGDVQYPGKEQSVLAPGMSVKVKVRFTPDSLGQYEDFVRVQSENGEMAVRIWAHRDPPVLDLKDPLDTGACLIGSYKTLEFPVTNVGGRGRFRLLDDKDFPQPRQAQFLSKKLRLGPFHIWPTQLSLKAGEKTRIFVKYTPQELGAHEAQFVLVSEGCDVRKFTVKAVTQEVYLNFQEIGRARAGEKLTLPKSLHFPSLAIGEVTKDIVSVRNNSCLGFQVHWCFSDVEGNNNDEPFHPGTCSTAMIEQLKGFEIRPNKSFIEAGATQDFTVSFQPSKVGRNQVRAKLVVDKVPLISVPTGEQEILKEVLRSIGGALGWLNFYSIFDKIDLNGDGYLDIAELQQAMKKVGMVSHKGAARRLMAQLNTKGDRSGDDSITLLEFMKNIPADLFQTIEKGLDSQEFQNSQDESQPSNPSLKAEDLEVMLRSVEVLGLDLWAAGEPHRVRCEPPCILPPGKLLAGQLWEIEVLLVNESTAETSFRFGPALVDSPDITEQSNEDMLSKSAGKVSVEPMKGIIPPNSRLPVIVSFKFGQAGSVAGRLPINIRNSTHDSPHHSNKGQDTISLRFETVILGPRLRIAQKEVDFGLIAVGGEEEKEILMVNESGVPIIWDFNEEGEGELRPHSSQSSVMNKGRLSRNTSISSMSSTGNQSTATRDSFMINSAFAKLVFTPTSGRIEPGKSDTTRVKCTAGKQPQRLRGRLECKVRDSTQGTQNTFFESQSLSYRGEIQAPKVFLNTTEIDLGISYVEQPVTRTLMLTNLSNLSTKFKWERPAGKPSSFVVTFDPAQGELKSKEIMKLQMTFVAKSPGLVDDLYACKIFGMKYPLGFTLKSTAKGVVISYDLLDGETEVLPPVPWDASQTASHPPSLMFDTVALFKRKTLRFALRNLSAIPTTFVFQPKKFGVHKPKPNKWKSAASLGRMPSNITTATAAQEDDKSYVSGFSKAQSKFSAVASYLTDVGSIEDSNDTPQRFLLDAQGEKGDVFRSELGRTHVQAKAQVLEDQAVLAGGNGVAFGVVPANGTLPPWGMLEVAVTVYNDMPGTYLDELQCDVRGAPRTNLSMKVKVTGCPLSIPKDSVGMRFAKGSEIPTLTFGEVLTQALPPTRVVRIKNSGPIDAMLTWHVRDPKEMRDSGPGGRPRLVDFKMDFNEMEASNNNSNLLGVRIRWHEPPPYDPPFEIRPPVKLVPARSESTFEIAIPDIPINTGQIEAYLVADAAWRHPEKKAVARPRTAKDREGARSAIGRKKKEDDEPSGLEAESLSAVTCKAESNAITPSLDAGGKTGLKFRVWSTHAATLGKFRGNKAPHPSMARQQVLTNRLSVPLTFCLSTNGPFRILGAHCLAPPHPLHQTLFTNSLYGRPAQGEIYTLPPGDNVVIDLGFLANAASQTLVGTAALSKNQPVLLKEEVKGSMTVQFSTGHLQEFDLTGIILRPMVVCAPSKYSFGVAVVGNSATISLSISNPTEVEAQWTLAHVPSTTFKKSRLDTGLGGMVANTDDPDVFGFSKVTGTLAGPTMPLKTAAVCLPTDVNRANDAVFTQTITTLKWHEPDKKDELQKAPYSLNVTFKPKGNVDYCSRFRIHVTNGEGFDFVLSGKGTFEENDQNLAGQPRM